MDFKDNEEELSQLDFQYWILDPWKIQVKISVVPSIYSGLVLSQTHGQNATSSLSFFPSRLTG